MAKKKAKAAGPKNFPKEQGEDGAPDRFIPPDRADQIPNEEDDRPTVVQVKDLAEGLEIVEDDDDEEREQRAEARDEDDSPDTFEGADDDGEEQEEGTGRRGNGRERHGRKVRARINRERALTKQQRVRADNAERRAKAVEDRLAKLERVTTEVSGSKQVTELKAAIERLKVELAQAMEKGETATQLDLTIKLGDVQGSLKLAERDLEDAKRKQLADEETRKTERAREDEAAAADGGDAAGEPDAEDWVRANGTWWGKPRFARQQSMAISLDKEIISQITDGELDVEKYSDEHFELLNERLAKLYPDLPLHNTDGELFEEDEGATEEEREMKDRDRDNRRDQRSSSRRPPVGGQGTGGRSGRRQVSDADLARQGKVRLAEGDFTQMRMYGLDPKNVEHKKRFAKERMRTILTDERREQRGTGARR